MLDQKTTVNTSVFNSTEGRTIPVPTNDSINREWFEKYAHIADENIQVGDPATYSCGSDSYAEVVTSVVRFKEGKRAGQIKHITLSRKDEKFLAYPVVCHEHARQGVSRVCIKCWLQAHNAVEFSRNADSYWISVRVGSQNPYLDPHF